MSDINWHGSDKKPPPKDDSLYLIQYEDGTYRPVYYSEQVGQFVCVNNGYDTGLDIVRWALIEDKQ